MARPTGIPRKPFVVPLAQGIDAGTDPKITKDGLLQLENAVFNRVGAVSKRRGSLSTIDTPSGEILMAARDGTPLVYGENVYAYTGDATGGTWDTAAPCGLADISVLPVRAGQREYRYYTEVKEVRSVRIVTASVLASGATNYYTELNVYNKISGALISNQQLTGTVDPNSRNAKLIVSGNDVYCFWLSAADLNYVSIDTLTGAVSGATNLVLGVAPAAGNFIVDCAIIQASPLRVMSAYVDAAGDIGLVVRDFGVPSWTQGSKALPVAATSVSVDRLRDNVGLVMWGDANVEIRAAGYSQALVEVVSNVQVVALPAPGVARSLGAIATSTVTAALFVTVGSSGYNTNGRIYIGTFTDAAGVGTVGGITSRFWGGVCTSKPFVDSWGRILCTSVYETASPIIPTGETADVQRLLVLFDIDGNILGKALVGTAFTALNPEDGWSSSVQTLGNDAWLIGGGKVVGYGGVVTGATSCAITIDRNPSQRRTLSLPGVTLLPSSVPMQFDGASCVEQGFLTYPEGIVVGVVAGGGAMSAGVYQFCVVYEWTDSRGRRHRSAPSVPRSNTFNANDRATITINTLQFTRRNNVSVVFYRTLANQGIFYRLAEALNVGANETVQLVNNGLADTTLAGYEKLYTTGGVVENTQPEQYKACCIHQDRVVYASREAESTDVLYSKVMVPSESVEFGDVYTLSAPHEGGAITALESLGDRLIIFKRDRIYATQGSGLNDLGQGGVIDGSYGFYPPSLVSPGVGCIAQQTVVRVPAGLMFLSAGGLVLLKQDLTLESIGEPVKHHTDTLTITAARHVPDLRIAIFLTGGLALVYNYQYKQWATWTGFAAHDAVVPLDVLYWLGTDNTVRVEQRSGWSDDGEPYRLKIVTPWYSFAGLMGYKRVARALVMGQNLSPHNLLASVGYDFDPVWTDSTSYDTEAQLGKYYDASAQYGPGLDPSYADKAYMAEVGTSRQKVTAIRFKLEDMAQGDPGEGWSATAMAFLVGLKPRTWPYNAYRGAPPGAGGAGVGSAPSGGAP